MIFESDVLGIEEADGIRDALLSCLENEEPLIMIDLINVNKIDLSIIQLFLSLRQSLHNQNRKMVLINCTNGVVDALKLSGCSQFLECSYE
ncbi:STAS domain-containing protein [bacterium]|nr:STAS domain-containing protein [bacterium]MBU1994191.1 STAS domain-containing protein [bacterium]